MAHLSKAGRKSSAIPLRTVSSPEDFARREAETSERLESGSPSKTDPVENERDHPISKIFRTNASTGMFGDFGIPL